MYKSTVVYMKSNHVVLRRFAYILGLNYYKCRIPWPKFFMYFVNINNTPHRSIKLYTYLAFLSTTVLCDFTLFMWQ